MDFDGARVFGAYLGGEVTSTGPPSEPDASSDDPVTGKVTEPTGKPLNMRDAPGGEIFATLRNTTVVIAVASTRHKGRQLVYVEKRTCDNAVAWLFHACMACREKGSHEAQATRLQPEAPGGYRNRTSADGLHATRTRVPTSSTGRPGTLRIDRRTSTSVPPR